MMTILFLDFDGVLHPSPAGGMVFCCLPHLWTILRARPEIAVVFSTSWRERFDPETMIDFVTSNGGEDLRDRFIGVTPVLGLSATREDECRAWLASHTDQRWLALDDDAGQFSDRAHLYLVDGQTGLTAADVHKILHR